jgi:hypothetical protein
MAITGNAYCTLLNHSTQTIVPCFFQGKPFLTGEEIAMVIAFTIHRFSSTKKNHCQQVNDSWLHVEEAYGFKVLWYVHTEKATI